jgi:carboxypeptidase family protein
VTQGRLRTLGALVLIASASCFSPEPAVAQSKTASGKLAGVVRDRAGTPQLGASVEVMPEAMGLAAAASQAFLTNTKGVFQGDQLTPGLYTVRVTLAGFLPTLEKHVRIDPNLTTVLRVRLESMFASLEQLRRQPAAVNAEPDDWKWVLRSAPNLRPVLEWTDDDGNVPSVVTYDTGVNRQARMRLEMTDGARRLASASNIAAAPATAFAYDQKIGGMSRLILAGQMSYDETAPGGGIATIWLPTGTLGAGPHTAVVLREAKVASGGPVFRGARIDQGGTIALGERTMLRYGGEYVYVGLGAAASSVRPRAELKIRANDNWTASVIFASMPSGPTPLEAEVPEGDGILAASLGELDAFPALLWRNGKPVLQSGWHEEISTERKLGPRARFQVAAFHDDNRHVAVYGRGDGLPAADYFQDFFSSGFAYDGGSSSSFGARVALREKFGNDTEVTAVYAFAGALSPADDSESLLRDVLRTQARHSLGAGISTRISKTGTRVETSYKWLSGTVVSRVDLYGESLYQLDPYLHIGVRQPLPKFALGRWEAIADCDNLLAQGYVPANTRDGHVTLVPALRTFRGGLSVQF